MGWFYWLHFWKSNANKGILSQPFYQRELTNTNDIFLRFYRIIFILLTWLYSRWLSNNLLQFPHPINLNAKCNLYVVDLDLNNAMFPKGHQEHFKRMVQHSATEVTIFNINFKSERVTKFLYHNVGKWIHNKAAPSKDMCQVFVVLSEISRKTLIECM